MLLAKGGLTKIITKGGFGGKKGGHEFPPQQQVR